MEQQPRPLSEKETVLLQLIEHSTLPVTTDRIERELGKEYLGGLGRLLQRNQIERVTKYVGDASNPYGRKKVKYYTIKKEYCVCETPLPFENLPKVCGVCHKDIKVG